MSNNIFSFLFGFRGRLPRRTFWPAFAVNRILIISISFLVLKVLFDIDDPSVSSDLFKTAPGIIFIVVYAILFLNALSLVTRRFHDTGKSVGTYFAMVIIGGGLSWFPLIGPMLALGMTIGIIVILCQPSDRDNQFGPITAASDDKDVESSDMSVIEAETADAMMPPAIPDESNTGE